MTDLARTLAIRWMPGTRKGSGKPAWSHPEAVVALLRDMPGLRPEDTTQEFLEATAWLHDVLEDGRKEDGTPVTREDLLEAGVSEEVVMAVGLLTKEPWMSDFRYYLILYGAPDLVKMVKVADRISNLTEGTPTLGPKWKTGYTRHTEDWVVPLTDGMTGVYWDYLRERLTAAMALMPSG